MACDRFVYFEDQVPSREMIKTILEDYIHGIGEVEKDDGPWITVKLPGFWSSPFRRINERGAQAQAVFGSGGDLDDKGRWFEIFFSLEGEDKNIDVITRLADEVTNNIAEGFARLIARYFQGRLVQG